MILLSFKHCKVLQLNYCWKAEKNKTKISLWCDKINRIILKSACNLSCLLSHALLSLQECFSRILLMSKKWLNIPSYHSAELFIRVKLLCWATFTWWLQSKTKHCAFFYSLLLRDYWQFPDVGAARVRSGFCYLWGLAAPALTLQQRCRWGFIIEDVLLLLIRSLTLRVH